jgi:hypothetical protein
MSIGVGIPSIAVLPRPLGQPGAGGSLFWGNDNVTGTTSTRYLMPGYEDTIAPLVAGIVQFRVPRAGTLRNLRVRHNGTAGNGNAIVYTIRINNAGTLLLVSMASTAADGSNLANTVVVAGGELIDLEVTKALSVGTSPGRIEAIVELA